jgi:hypothetical protein
MGQQRIIGSVINEGTHSPVPAAAVKLKSDGTTQAVETATDTDGRFLFAALSPGTYLVTVSADTFYPQEVALTLGPRATMQLSFELKAISAIKEEVIVSTKSKLLDQTETATATNLDSKQIEMLPTARRVQLSEIISPFVSSAVSGHDNLVHLRGNELSLNTFINGVSFYDNPHQLFTPGLSPDVIRSVNVVAGGFPAEFGNRFGGVLDIVTRSGFDASGHGSATIGASTFLRNNVSFDYGSHTRRFGYFFYGQGFESGRFLNTPEPNLLHDKGYGARSFAQLDYRPGARDSFRAVLTGDGTNFQLPNTTDDALRGRDFFQRNREQTAVLSWDHSFSTSSNLSTSFYERFAGARLLPTSDPVSIQAAGLRNDITLGAKTDYSLFLSSRHVIKTGLDFMVLRLREDFIFDPRNNEVEVEAFDFLGRRTGVQGSAYFQDKFQVTNNFTANLGLRYDNYSLVIHGQELSPRINLVYSMQGGRTLLHFAYNRFFAPPPIENQLLSAHQGFGGLPPQIARSNFLETGVSHTAKDRLLLRLSGFYRSDKNAFETTEFANVRIFAPTSFARGRAYGIESSLQLSEIKRLGVSGYLNYTAQRVFLTGPISGGFTVEQIEGGEQSPAAFDQIHTGVAGVTYRERRTGFFATSQLEYGSGTPAALANIEGEEELVRLPSHFVANLYFGIDLPYTEGRKISLQVNVENVTNRVFQIAKESEFTPVQYSPPRFISGSVKVHF